MNDVNILPYGYNSLPKVPKIPLLVIHLLGCRRQQASSYIEIAFRFRLEASMDE